MIKFKCASCGKGYQLPDSAAGRKARCKACGAAMKVPAATDGLLDDGPSAGDDLSSLYGGSEPSDIIDPSAAVQDPVAFTPGASFQQNPRPSSSSGPPMKLLIGAGAGALALILIVVVVVVVMGGGGEKQQDDETDALAFNPTASGPADRPSSPASTDPVDEGAGARPETDVSLPDPSDPPAEPAPGTSSDPADATTQDASEDAGDAGPPVDPGPDPLESGVLSAPTDTGYGIVVPADMNIIAQTRTSVRTAPHDDGTWLVMEVHPLEAPEAQAASALAEDGSTVLLRGQRVPVPEGVEVSTLASGRHTIHRLLYPVNAGQQTRRVDYVVKDGASLVSVLARYPAEDASRLVMLDAVAGSVQPVKDR